MATDPVPVQSPFLRSHSGLARAAGGWDVFIFNIGLVSIGIGLAYTQRFANAYYPLGSIPIASILAGLLMLPVALAMWCWTVAMPRSGGIYVFLTRSFHPGIGFALSFAECVSWLFYAAIAARLFITVGMIPMIGMTLGYDAGIVVSLQAPLVQLVLGCAVIWASVWLLVTGTGRYLRAQRVVFIIALMGLAASIYCLVNSTPAAVDHRLSALISGHPAVTVSEIEARARSAGWKAGSHTLAGSAALLVWPFLPLIGSVFSISIGGEVRNSRSHQLLGMIGSLVVSVVLFVVCAVVADRGMGNAVQGATAYLWDLPSAQASSLGGLHIKAEPWFPVLVGLSTDNLLLKALVGLGFMAWVYFWIPGVLAYCSRAMLAWSLDRVGPSWLGTLHQRYATPWPTYVVGGLLATLFLVLVLYTSFFATLVFIQAAAIAWSIALAFGTFFPWRRPQLFSMTPVADWKVGSVPWMAIVNLIGALALGYAAYLLWNDGLAAGHSPNSLLAIGTTFVLGLAIYFVMARMRAREGNPITRAYREIPVE
jgi:basic amino acid/polyamine antiporter, APA family